MAIIQNTPVGARAMIENTFRAEEAVARLSVGVASAVMSAANYALSGSGSQSISESISS